MMLGAVMFAHDECKKVVNAIIDLAEKAAKEPWDLGHGRQLGDEGRDQGRSSATTSPRPTS